MYANNITHEETTEDFHAPSNSHRQVSPSLDSLRVVQIVNHVVLSGVVCLFGIIANIVNLIVFTKQGLRDTVNLSLFAISFSDLCSLVTLEWLNMNLNPFMENADVPFEPIEIQYFTGGWPHACFARITIWVTIYVTAERFCCIAFPLKVKQIITPMRTKTAIITIYSLMLSTLALEYVPMYFGQKFFPSRNLTRVGLVDRDLKVNIESSVFLLYAVIGIVSFVTLIMLTAILISSLKRRSSWRKRSALEQNQSSAISSRDKKTVKMVFIIALIVIVCFTPAILLYVTVFIVPGFDLTGIHAIMFHITWSIAFLAEAVSSSANIFLFYKMSSKYRRTFDEMFFRCRAGQTCTAGEPTQGTSPFVGQEAASGSSTRTIDSCANCSQARPSADCNETRPSADCSQTRPSANSSQARPSADCNETRPSADCSQTRPSADCSQTRRVLAVVKPGQVLTVVKPGRVLTVFKPGRVLAVVKPGRVLTVVKPDRVLTVVKPGRVLTVVKPGLVLTVVKPDRVLAVVKPGRVLAVVKPGRVLTVVKPGRVLTVVKPGRELTVVKPGRVLAVVKPGRVLTVVKPGRVLTVVKPGRVLTSLNRL